MVGSLSQPRRWWRRIPPPAALAILCALSVGLRAGGLAQPCYTPCRAPTAHLLIFDEDYYVNAARIIAGVRPPANAPYAQAPLGDDPNAEHPQLAKLVMAGMIELLGNHPLAWRLPSLIVGTLALLGMYALTRAAGGGEWFAVGATALMAADNLLLVHGRIATLDIFVLTGMLWSVVAYLRGRPWLAGALLGVAAAAKMVGPYALAVVALIELGGWAATRDRPLARLGRVAACAAAGAAVLFGLLALFDRVAPPYDNSAAKLVRGGPLGHLSHMFSYAAAQTSPHGPTGIASYAWQWLYDFKPITYLNINPSQPAPGLQHVSPPVHFLGVISPPILLAGVTGLIAIVVTAWPAARLGAPRSGASRSPGVRLVAVAWFLGTYLPFVALSLFWQRTSYLYYMVIVMPGLYLAAADLAARVRRAGRWVWLVRGWALTVVIALIVMYPFTPLP